MDTVRFFGLAAGMFAAVFLGMSWLLTVRPLQPDARLPSFQQVDKDSPRFQVEQTSISDDDPTRDRLRQEVLDDARALKDDPCNDILKTRYIKAANAYAHAWISIAPCLGTRTCGSADSSRIDRAAHAFGSPLDHRVREAMQRVHAKAVFKLGDFPNDTAPLVADLAADGSINPLAVRATVNGPINAQNDPGPQRSFAEIKAQFGDSDARQDCGH
jgi:hypothetical protein